MLKGPTFQFLASPCFYILWDFSSMPFDTVLMSPKFISPALISLEYPSLLGISACMFKRHCKLCMSALARPPKCMFFPTCQWLPKSASFICPHCSLTTCLTLTLKLISTYRLVFTSACSRPVVLFHPLTFRFYSYLLLFHGK